MKTDIVVVGCGLLGSSAARHIADKGVDVVLIGPGEPLNKAQHDGVFGSHYDSGRITRILDRDAYHSDISARSYARFSELEERTGFHFFHPSGHLVVSGMAQYLGNLKQQGQRHQLNVTEYDSTALASAFPRLSFAEGQSGICEHKTAGWLDPRKLIQAEVSAMTDAGGIQLDATVIDITEGAKLAVTTNNAQVIECKKVLLATGAFANHLGIIPRAIDFEVQYHTTLYCELTESETTELADMPSIIYKRGDAVGQSTYTLPPVRYPDGKVYLKIGQSTGRRMHDPARELIPWFQSSGDSDIAHWLKEELDTMIPGLEIVSQHTESCVVTKSPTGRQFIDRFPNTEIYSMLADNGQVAKSADELGYVGACLLTEDSVPAEYEGENLSLQFC